VAHSAPLRTGNRLRRSQKRSPTTSSAMTGSATLPP
jgi:hypothetical protein